MKGLEISRGYYEATFETLFGKSLASLRNYAAAGLSGEGSECFGFDDGLSQDHDFSPDYCVWFPYRVYREHREELENAYNRLPCLWRGMSWKRTPLIASRRGIQSIEGYFQKYTGLTHVPEDNSQWLGIPESFLAVATNGEVFEDALGEFGRWRQVLTAFYPRDVVLKKLAARLSVMGQAGQYNYPRCVKRGDIGGAYLAAGEFCRSALSAIYLLNRKYMPFYKWSFIGARDLARLGSAVDKLEGFIRIADNRFLIADESHNTKIRLVEEICEEVAGELRLQGFSVSGESFLVSQAEELMANIEDSRLRSMNPMADVG